VHLVWERHIAMVLCPQFRKRVHFGGKISWSSLTLLKEWQWPMSGMELAACFGRISGWIECPSFNSLSSSHLQKIVKFPLRVHLKHQALASCSIFLSPISVLRTCACQWLLA
jgi:hypothetical protein